LTESPWFGEVPEHWKLLPARALFREVDGRNQPDEQLLSVTIGRGIVPQRELLADGWKDSSNEDKAPYKLVEPGDFVYNKMRAWQGAIGLSVHRGIVSPAYVVQRPRTELNARFFHYLLRTPAFAKEAERLSYGIASDQWSLRPEHFKLIPLPVPSLQEQAVVVRFLDHADRRIRRGIRAKHKLIALLNEQKRAVVHRAVTRGLDPNVRLKPSGVDWLGDVPEHWETRRIRECITNRRAGLWGDEPTAANAEDHIVCIRVADFDMERLRVGTSKLPIRAVPKVAARPRLLVPGDVLIEKSGGGDVTPVGRAVLYDLPEAAISSNFVTRVRPDRAVLQSEWLLFALAVLHATRANVPFIKQTTGIQNLDEAAYFAQRVALPPLDEQDVILAHLRRVDEEQRMLLEKARRQIELLREYRTRLIADVVTGKLDVRGAAADLPDEPEELEPPDEIEAEQMEEPEVDYLEPVEA
jgi:type I restriction enzyme S subunit